MGLTTSKIDEDSNTSHWSDQDCQYAYLASIVFGYDSFGWGEHLFSCCEPNNGIVMRARPNIDLGIISLEMLKKLMIINIVVILTVEL